MAIVLGVPNFRIFTVWYLRHMGTFSEKVTLPLSFLPPFIHHLNISMNDDKKMQKHFVCVVNGVKSDWALFCQVSPGHGSCIFIALLVY